MTFSNPGPILFEGLGAWEEHAVGLEETVYEHHFQPLGLLSRTALEHELPPPAPLNPFSYLNTQRTEIPDTHPFISHDRGCAFFVPLCPDSSPLHSNAEEEGRE